MLAGNEASRPLAIMDSDICQHVNGPISEISISTSTRAAPTIAAATTAATTTRQTEILEQWVDRFNEKYSRVGYLEGWHAEYQGRTITLQPKQKQPVMSQFGFGSKFVRALSVSGM